MKDLRKYLQFDEKQNDIFIPNEIFEDFKTIKKNHIPFAFSYYYLTNWLYRYAKYGFVAELLTQKELKQILGYSPIYKPVDYLIKKNGVLEQMKYLETTNEIPTTWEMGHSFQYDISEDLAFNYYEYDAEMNEYGVNFPNRYVIKKPIRAFTRHVNDEEAQEDYENDYIDGTFYDVSNTTLIPFEVFLFCMENEQIGCTGFYLWSYLKMNNQFYDSGFDIPLEKLAEETGISKKSLSEYLKLLRKHRMIEVIHNQEAFVVGLRKEDRKANTYITGDHDFFCEVGDEKVETMKVMTRKEYFEKLKKEQEERDKKKADIPVDALPY
ncbi:hypothetical protein MKZ02_19780 [Pseudobacillus sp. FSL P4-0506]|uniref:hypothetical protein n=1 Tax=Pseudobacillus sp. FSL P4-0506 TaxID=2921576 RepID=UPI0030F5BE6E